MEYNTSTHPLLVLLFSSLFINLAISDPPTSPITCSSPKNKNCTITNAIGMFPDRSICKAAEVVYPSTEQELVQIVATAAKRQQKMKVATRYYHSTPKLACPDGETGLLISTDNLTKLVGIDRRALTMTVESGMLLRDVIDQAAKVGLCLPCTPYWWGLTVGGMMGTGAHGSTLWGNGSAVHDYVVGVRIVSPGMPEEGYVKVRTLDVSCAQEELNAVKVSLGVLGVISQVTLQLQPLFKRAITYKEMDDHDLAVRALQFGYQHEFADITWYPRQKKAVYRIDDRVSSNVSGDGQYDFISFRSVPTALMVSLRKTEDLVQETRNINLECFQAMLMIKTFTTMASGLENKGNSFTGYPVVGYQNRMQSSGSCLDSKDDNLTTACSWDPRIKAQFYHQTSFTLPLSKVKSFIKDVQKLVALNPRSMCLVELYNGILMRYVKASTGYLGAQEDGISFDITYYRSKDPLAPRLFEYVLEEIEQMAVFKYGGLPHWGKNRNLVFDGIIKRYKKGREFVKVKEKFDPLGLFSSEWSNQMLGLEGGVSIVDQGCALEGLCICSEDIHCAPTKGYFCRPGKVYKEARVCTDEA